MNRLRYVVVRWESEWKIVQGGRRYSEAYHSKRQALSAAIEFAEKHSHAGRHAEVLVRDEDGHFMPERIFGSEPQADEAVRPLLTPKV
jgi:Uncharacterized protein conserved in bacteria (DUF2188)